MKNTEQQNLSISPNSTTKYSNTITVGNHIKRQSHLSPTDNETIIIRAKRSLSTLCRFLLTDKQKAK